MITIDKKILAVFDSLPSARSGKKYTPTAEQKELILKYWKKATQPCFIKTFNKMYPGSPTSKDWYIKMHTLLSK